MNNYQAQSDIWRLKQVKGRKGGQSTYLNSPHRLVKEATQKGQSRVLARAYQVFPLAFFPDQVVVEELRIVWVKKNGPWSDEIVSIMATDIAAVDAASGPFFGHLHIKSLTGGPEIMVDNLSRKDVFRVRNLVEGIALSAREGLRVDGESFQREIESLHKAGEIS